MTDARTIAFYDRNARDYGKAFGQTPSPRLRDFIAALPDGAEVLDLGCGPGHAARHMAAAGLRPDPVDASPGMVDLARAAGLPARVMRFDQLEAEAAYDGVWANFSLTHAPSQDLPGHLSAIARALRPGGLFHIGVKTGSGAHRDRLGRLYHLIEPDDLEHALTAAGFTVISRHGGADTGFDGETMPYIILQARRNG